MFGACIRGGHLPVLDLLPSAGADTEKGGTDGETPLIIAAEYGQTPA